MKQLRLICLVIAHIIISNTTESLAQQENLFLNLSDQREIAIRIGWAEFVVRSYKNALALSLSDYKPSSSEAYIQRFSSNVSFDAVSIETIASAMDSSWSIFALSMMELDGIHGPFAIVAVTSGGEVFRIAGFDVDERPLFYRQLVLTQPNKLIDRANAYVGSIMTSNEILVPDDSRWNKCKKAHVPATTLIDTLFGDPVVTVITQGIELSNEADMRYFLRCYRIRFTSNIGPGMPGLIEMSTLFCH